MPELVEYKETSRGVGLTDMIMAIREGRPPRCALDIGLHMVEIFEAFETSAETRRTVDLTTTCQIPRPRWRKY